MTFSVEDQKKTLKLNELEIRKALERAQHLSGF